MTSPGRTKLSPERCATGATGGDQSESSGANAVDGGVLVFRGSAGSQQLRRHTEHRPWRSAGTGGSAGHGGGLYIDVGATVTATNTTIKKNTASTTGDDIFGTLS